VPPQSGATERIWGDLVEPGTRKREEKGSRVLCARNTTHNLDVREPDQHEILHYERCISTTPYPPSHHRGEQTAWHPSLPDARYPAIVSLECPTSHHSRSSHPIPPAPTTSTLVSLTLAYTSEPSSDLVCEARGMVAVLRRCGMVSRF
jgi:hypothetical protein